MDDNNKRNTIELYKSGIFYNAYNEDAVILNYFFNYKVSVKKSVGFPQTKLDKVTDELDKRRINYIVYDNNEIVKKNLFSRSFYNKYLTLGLNKFYIKKAFNELLEKVDNMSEEDAKRVLGVLRSEIQK
jgi:hypothetical protein